MTFFKKWLRAMLLLFILSYFVLHFALQEGSQLYQVFKIPTGNYTTIIVNVTPWLVNAYTEGMPVGYNLTLLNTTPYEALGTTGPYINATLKLLSLNASMITPTAYFRITDAFGGLVNTTPGVYVNNYTLHAFKIFNDSPNVLLILRLWNMSASPWYNVTYPPSSNITSIKVVPIPSGSYKIKTKVVLDWYNYYYFLDPWLGYTEYTKTVGNVTYEYYYYYDDLMVYGCATLIVNGHKVNTTYFNVIIPWYGGSNSTTIYGDYKGYLVAGSIKAYSPYTTIFKNYTTYQNGQKVVIENWTCLPVTPPQVTPEGGTVMILKYNVFVDMVITVYNGTDPVTYVGDTPVAKGDGTFYIHKLAYVMVANQTYNVTLNVTTKDRIWFKLNGSLEGLSASDDSEILHFPGDWYSVQRTWLTAVYQINATPVAYNIPANHTTIIRLKFTIMPIVKNVPPNWIFNNTFNEVYKHNYAYELMQMGYYYTIYKIFYNFTNWYTWLNPYYKNNPSVFSFYHFEYAGLAIQVPFDMNYTTKNFTYPIQALWAKKGNVMMRAIQPVMIVSFGEWYYYHGNVSLLQIEDVPPPYINITLWNMEWNYSQKYIKNYTNSYPPLVYWLGNGTKYKNTNYFIFVETIAPAYLGNDSNFTWVVVNLNKTWIPQIGSKYTMYDFYSWFPLMSLTEFAEDNITIQSWANISYFYYTIWKVYGVT